jgi:hypothetical protein
MAVTYGRYKFVTVSLPKRFRNGRFTSETATWIQKYLKNRWDFQKALDRIVFQGGDDGRGYRNMSKTPRGSNSKEGDWYILYNIYSSAGINIYADNNTHAVN